MTKIQLRPAALAFLFTLSAVPSAALAFVTVDTLPWPSFGRFPAYAADDRPPTTLWVQGGVMRDDNLLRRESGRQGDTVTRVGVGIRHEQRVIGRQRVVAEARTDYYDFHRFNSLDHFAYSLLGTWDWEVGNNLGGSVVAGREKRLIDTGETGGEPTRDFVTLTRLGATGGLLVTPSFRLRGGVATTWGERSLRSDIETRAAAWTAGAEYVSPLRNTLGVEYRNAYDEAPETIAPLGIDNDSREKELALIATYSPGPSVLSAWRLGKTHRGYTQLPGRDFKGTTYLINARWFPGNKTLLFFEAYRLPRSILDVAASHVLIRGVDFGPSWAATTKLVFSARLVRERRQFQGDPALVLTGAPLRDELLYVWRFGVGWEPQRQWQVSAALDHGTRESNFAGRDYDYNALSLNVAWRY